LCDRIATFRAGSARSAMDPIRSVYGRSLSSAQLLMLCYRQGQYKRRGGYHPNLTIWRRFACWRLQYGCWWVCSMVNTIS
jgi:hypothetical protein